VIFNPTQAETGLRLLSFLISLLTCVCVSNAEVIVCSSFVSKQGHLVLKWVLVLPAPFSDL